MLTEARLRHRGTFNLSARGSWWRPFRSEQLVVAYRPGFDWQARIAALPGLPVLVRDAYVQGQAILRASLFGLLPVADLPSSTELAVGELMRFLAEAVWYPTVLAPGHGVQWTPAGDQSAQAILTDGEASAALRFTFGDSGLVESVSTEARPRAVKRKFIPTAWEGRFWDYRRVEGMTIPHSGEVAWVIQGVRRPYWRGEVEDVGYTFAE